MLEPIKLEAAGRRERGAVDHPPAGATVVAGDSVVTGVVVDDVVSEVTVGVSNVGVDSSFGARINTATTVTRMITRDGAATRARDRSLGGDHGGA